MNGMNSNIMTLLNSLNTEASFNFTDYAAIKNGSYGKLVKSYYAQQKAEATQTENISSTKAKSSADSKTSETAKKEQVDSTGFSQLRNSADSLQKAAEKLQSEDLWKKSEDGLDMSQITDAVKNFADKYNAAVSDAGKVTSKEASHSVEALKSMTSTMSNALGRIGINVSASGKMSFDEDAFAKADMGFAQKILSGKYSYGSQVAAMAGELSKDAVMNSSIYTENAALTNALPGVFNDWM